MATSAAHYDTHLGPVYSWMLGDLEAAFARGAAANGMVRIVAVEI
jgi:hypothetical protein